MMGGAAILGHCSVCGDPLTEPGAYRAIRVRDFFGDPLELRVCHESCWVNMIDGERIRWGAAEKERLRQGGEGPMQTYGSVGRLRTRIEETTATIDGLKDALRALDPESCPLADTGTERTLLTAIRGAEHTYSGAAHAVEEWVRLREDMRKVARRLEERATLRDKTAQGVGGDDDRGSTS